MAVIGRATLTVEGDVCIMRWSNGFVGYVDAADYERVAPYGWRLKLDRCGVLWYVRAKKIPRTWPGAGDEFFLHRFIMNAEKGQIVDHINFNTLDNRRSNLRFVTAKESANHTRRRTKEATTGG